MKVFRFSGVIIYSSWPLLFSISNSSDISTDLFFLLDIRKAIRRTIIMRATPPISRGVRDPISLVSSFDFSMVMVQL